MGGLITMFEWRKNYETGIEELDKQHQRLFEIANNAYGLLKNEYRTDKYDDIVEIIKELKDYTTYHFTDEEKYMVESVTK
jgi:hemerythrin